MEETTPKQRFLASVSRCIADEQFIPAFYERFLAASDEIRDRFRFTDFEKQNQMLQRSLELCAGATAGEPEALVEINERAKSHDRDHLNIHPEWYQVWEATIIQTAAEYDPAWDKEVEAAWNRILGFVVEHMIRKY